MSKFFQKSNKVPVAKLTTPEGGVFAGRHIPKNRINDENWSKVLELPKPPEDGLYVPREAVIEAAKPKPVKKKGLLYKIAKAMVDYDVAHDPKHKKTKPKSSMNLVEEPVKNREVLSVPKVTDWDKVSPDTEAEYLGLEQLQANESSTIIGAGVTGLTLAWISNRARPDIKITVYDAANEVGGWMNSRKIAVGDGHEMLCESGPRTSLPSHPGSEIIARILAEIGRRDELMAGVPRNSPTNQKALVFNQEVEQSPNNSLAKTIKFLLSNPLLKGTRFQALKDSWNSARNPRINDESVHSFMSRRIGPKLADRMVSAIMRGIYAADSRELSARSVARLNRLYYLERTEQMSILGAMFSGSLGFLDSYGREALPVVFDASAPPASRSMQSVERHLTNKENAIPKFSLYAFPNGIQGLAKALADDSAKRRNVDIKLGSAVRNIKPAKSRSSHIDVAPITDKTASEEIETNMVVSTVAKPELFTSTEIQNLSSTQKYSSLAVVNVWVPDPKAAKDWFGISIPHTENDWNKDGVIGVIFDSSVRNATHNNEREPGSSMTVMIGGDLWEEMTEAEARTRTLNALRKLKIVNDETSDDKIITNVTLQRDAIPLYEVGHSSRQHQLNKESQAAYRNRVAVIGMAFGRGCGVSDCVVDALTIASRFSEQRKSSHPEYFFNHWWSTTRPEYYA